MATFSTSLSQEPLPPSAANVLQAPGISKLLQAYPNRRFVDTLMSIVLTGVRVGFQGNPDGITQSLNHSSALQHPEVVRQTIQDEIRKERVVEIAESDLPSSGYFCSPIGLVPKTIDGVQTGWRVIFDLSSPLGFSVNDGIPKEFGTLVYETLNDAIQLVAQVGRGGGHDEARSQSRLPSHPDQPMRLLVAHF